MLLAKLPIPELMLHHRYRYSFCDSNPADTDTWYRCIPINFLSIFDHLYITVEVPVEGQWMTKDGRTPHRAMPQPFASTAIKRRRTNEEDGSEISEGSSDRDFAE